MSLRDLSGWLIKNQGFLRKYQALVANSIKDQFPELKSDVIPQISSEDVGYLLTCASSLAFSSDEKCQDAALRIAQYCLLNEKSEARKDSAALILDSLSNNPAIQLAENRGYLNPDFEERLPLKAQLELTKRKILYTIEIDADKHIYANRFQSEFWDAVQENSWVSVSAPTSVGKSFILESWVEQFVKRNKNCLVIYIVPTRALISEVYSELQKRLDPNLTNIVNIQTLPLSNVYQSEKSNVFIFTQERLNLFYNHFSQIPKIDVLVVDEAHKIGDGGRGVILQHVIELTCLNNPDSKVIFASPFTLNPEILLSDAPILKNKRTIKSDYVTVNQNLIWVEQKPRKTKDWLMYYFANGEKRELGNFSLENAPSPESKRLPFVALCLGKGASGNVVYVNGAAEAESTSKLISASIENETEDEEILALVELSETIIHKNFALNRTLKKRVAFHYGNMPLIIKGEIERLFSKGKIDFLICTSTLVEGVNMTCKNIFIRGPKKGNSTPMREEDFWNLAGRAGRWGKEFQGNVICIDSDNEKIWNGEPPKTKKNIFITRATDAISHDMDKLVSYIFSEHHFGMSERNPNLQSLFSYLCSSFYFYNGLDNNPYMEKYNIKNIDVLNEAIFDVFDSLTFPHELVVRHPGISPLLMQNLWDRFSRDTNKPVERLLLSEPGSNDALDSYVSAFSRISDTLSKKLGYNSKGAYVQALLVSKWMKGYPLARLISDRIRYNKKKNIVFKEATLIRGVMKDVEEIARYQAPRLLGCYNDLLKSFYLSIDRTDLAKDVEDIGVYLELGVSLKTQISLIGLGFSRTAAVMISELIPNDSLDEEECINWIKDNKVDMEELPQLVQNEIHNIFRNFWVQ